MSELCIVVLDPAQTSPGEAYIPIRSLVENGNTGESRWVERPGVLVYKAEDGSLTAVPIHEGEKIVLTPDAANAG